MFGFRTNRLLKEFSLAAEADFFYASIWECVVTSAPVRQAALDFVLRHFNKRLSMEDQLHFMGTNIEMLVKNFTVLLLKSLRPFIKAIFFSNIRLDDVFWTNICTLQCLHTLPYRFFAVAMFCLLQQNLEFSCNSSSCFYAVAKLYAFIMTPIFIYM